MWCKNCRQDVAGVPRVDDGKPCCVRCGATFAMSLPPAANDRAVPAPEVGDPAMIETVPLRAPLSTFYGWELEEQLRHVERVLSGARFTTHVERPQTAEAVDDAAYADAHDAPAAPGGLRQRLFHRRHAKPRISKVSRLGVIGGAAALVCGIVLLCVGIVIRSPFMQGVGLPITLLGQVAVLIGMVMQLDLVRLDHRRTAEKLRRFQKQLVDLESIAAELEEPLDERMVYSRPNHQRMVADLRQRLDHLSHRLNLPGG